MKEKILECALRIAEKKGLQYVTREAIAEDLDISTGSVTYHFGNMRKLYAQIVSIAIEKQLLPIIGRAVCDKHPLAVKCPEPLKQRALRALATS